ncbi:MAG: hypothetical protein IPL03_18350 [Sterolibacteriaceae bacterium]|nr:hypothetical protein [Candidatus Methylophosphatis haderslevensis]
MRLRSNRSLRRLAGWLIAALLFAQHAASWHAVEHIGAGHEARSLNLAPGDAGGSAPEFVCAKCLAFASLDHFTSNPNALLASDFDNVTLAPSAPPLFLPCQAPTACSRGPPLFLS